MSTAIITRTYQDHAISYNGEGWFNATEAAAKFDKRLDHWLNNKETKEYIAVLAEDSNTPLSGYLKTKRGNNGGTWLHPKLAVVFARWLDVRFAVWCDSQIDSIIKSKDDWRKLRHAASSSTKVQDAMLLHVRQAIGKATEAKHWMNEHKLINSLLTGEWLGLRSIRDRMAGEVIAELAATEEGCEAITKTLSTLAQSKDPAAVGAIWSLSDAWVKTLGKELEQAVSTRRSKQ